MTVTVERSAAAADVHARLARHLLVDGFDLVLDLDRSHGSWLVDARDGTRVPRPVHVLRLVRAGHEPPRARRRPGLPRRAARRPRCNKPSNSDVYTVAMARFVDTFARVLGDPALPHLFFIEGGARGRRERAEGRVRLEVAAERGARARPRTRHPGAAPARGVPRPHRLHDVAHQHRSGQDRPLPEVRLAADRHPRTCAPASRTPSSATVSGPRSRRRRRPSPRTRTTSPASIVEPIQGEGGDHHFRPEFLQALQRLCHEHDALFVVDEVQTGCGLTGTPWAYQQLGLAPGRRRVRQEDAGLRRDGGRAGGRGARQRLRGQLADQLHLGRRAHRHGARPAHPGGRGGRRADPPRRVPSADGCSRCCATSRTGTPA